MVGAIGGQEQEPRADLLQTFGCPGALVDGKVVEDDDVAWAEGRRELGLDIGVESDPVDGPVDDEGRGQPIAAQAGDEGLCSPFAERRLGSEPLAARGAAARSRHLGVDRCLVDEDQAMRLAAHPKLTPPDPGLPALRMCSRAHSDAISAFFICEAGLEQEARQG